MSPVLPLEIISLIIDNVGEKDTNFLKQLALVSHSFQQICIKHLFATVELHDASSKKGFIKLLKRRPDVVKYIRKLTYKIENNNQLPTCPSFVEDDDYLLSSILPNLLRTIPHLNCLTINASSSDWNTLDSSLTSAFIHLMYLPTMNHISLSFIRNFPPSILSSSANLHRLDMRSLKPLQEDGFPEVVMETRMMPKIREFHTSDSDELTTKLLHAKGQDGRPAFNFMDLRRLSMSFTWSEDEQNLRYLLQNAKLLEELDLTVFSDDDLVGLQEILSPTLKVLDLTVSLYSDFLSLPLARLCNELEAMAGHNILEALSLKVHLEGHETGDFIGSIFQSVEKVLVKPGWSSLRHVFFEVRVSIACWGDSEELCEAIQCLPGKYLSHLSKLESVTFDYLANVQVGHH